MFWSRKKAKKKRREQRREIEEEEEERAPWHADLHTETKRSVWAVLSFCMALIFLLAWFGKAGLAGERISSFFTLLFGNAFLVVPIMFLLAGISFLFGMRQRVMGGTFFGALLFLVSVLGLGEIIGGPETSGYVGLGIALAPLKFFDVAASSIIFGTILLISLLLMFNKALVPRRIEKEEPQKEMPVNEMNTTDEEHAATEKRGLFARMVRFLFGKRQFQADMPAALEPVATSEEMAPASAAIEPALQEMPAPLDDGVLPIKDDKPVAYRRVPSSYKPPPLNLLEEDRGKPSSGDVRANANIIQRTLQNFDIDVDMGEVNIGPSVTQYTLKPAEGIKLERITNLASNLGMALAAHPLRIEAPIPGRSLVGVEVPNKSISFVGLRRLMAEFTAKKREMVLGFALGRDVTGTAVFTDIARMPHLLIAGSTGSGKSVTIHSLLLSLLFSNPPEMLRFIMIDPKRVEMVYYSDIPHLLTPVVTEAKKAIVALRWAVREMEQRYKMLQDARARDIVSYNSDAANADILPHVVIIVDELAELMAIYPREVEANITRLSSMARAVGIHLVVSTQRPSVNVITGLIKANITTRIALQVASQIDSRTILGAAGAEKLLGKGDMLYQQGDGAKPRRIQGVFVSESEVKRVTQYLQQLAGDVYPAAVDDQDVIFGGQSSEEIKLEGEEADDEKYEEARELVIAAGKASISMLQRRLGLGYARAGKLIDMLEDRGVVGPGDGAKPRDVLVSREAENVLERDLHEA